jgi:hypothetical protein
MLRFRQMRSLQKFASVHANVHNHFNLERHLVDRKPTSSSAQPPWPSGRSTRARLPSSKTGVHRRETSSHWTDSTGARPSRRPSLAQRLARDDRARRTGSAQSAPSPDRGDAIELDPSQVQPTTLLLHELVANAHRHGALSVAEGGLSIAWGSDPTARELRITWTEAGGLLLRGTGHPAMARR